MENLNLIEDFDQISSRVKETRKEGQGLILIATETNEGGTTISTSASIVDMLLAASALHDAICGSLADTVDKTPSPTLQRALVNSILDKLNEEYAETENKHFGNDRISGLDVDDIINKN